MPPEQVQEFNRYLALLTAANRDVSAIHAAIEAQVYGLVFQQERLSLLEHAAAQLEEFLGVPATRPGRHWQKRGDIGVPAFLRGLAAELYDGLFREADLRWRELRSIEVVWDEIADDFGGVHPALPALRERLEQTKDKVRELAATLGKGRRRALSEPGPEMLDEYRDTLAQGPELEFVEREPEATTTLARGRPHPVFSEQRPGMFDKYGDAPAQGPEP